MHFAHIFTYKFNIPKNITSYNFLLVFKMVESLQCILKPNSKEEVVLIIK